MSGVEGRPGARAMQQLVYPALARLAFELESAPAGDCVVDVDDLQRAGAGAGEAE